jgi:Protein O-mannosyl-transferase TMEM260-like
MAESSNLNIDRQNSRLNLYCALAVLIVTIIAYLKTVQPTVPYWDCGEFIAAAATLSVPHPPGTPLFMLIGRLFAMLPFGGEVGWRVNLLSAISSGFAAMVAYYIIAWIISKWYKSVNDIYKRATICIGGITGALIMAFSRTFWTNAVEAEVYGLSMLIMLLCIYLIMQWTDHRHEKSGEKYLILFAFLSVIALGVHMASFIVVPAAFIYILAVSREYRISLPFIITFTIINIIPFSVTIYLILSTLWLIVLCFISFWDRIKNGWLFTAFIPLVLTLMLGSSGYSWVPIIIYCFAGWSILTLIIYRFKVGDKFWRMGILITLLGLIGFSSQLYTPVRSHADPLIDMNDPESWEGVRDFIERKQYGSESMFTRMLKRRAEWGNQFGTHERMGFWGFFHEQYSSVKWFVLFLILGLIGIVFTIRQKWRLGTFMFLILLAGTLGLILYMNFADGSQQHPLTGSGRLEVRDRDYFFTPGFVMFAIFIGIGIATVMHNLFGLIKKAKLSEVVRKTVLILTAAMLLLPIVAFSQNYFYCDRSRNYLPFHYANNLLQSCRENAILFTNGDNDTFPVWCLQYGYGIRPDVRVIVLSLLGTDWYAKKQRDDFNVPIIMSDEEILSLRPRIVNDELYNVSNIVTDHIIDNALVKTRRPDLWPELPIKFKKFIKLDSNRIAADTTLYFDPPIQFATTVDQFGFKYREKHISESKIDAVIEGLVHNVVPYKSPYTVNREATADFFINTFNTDGVKDSTIYKDGNASRLADNYWKILAKMADDVFNAGSWDEAVEMNIRAVKVSGNPAEAFRFLTKNLKYSGRLQELYEYIPLVESRFEEKMYERSGQMMDALFSRDFNDQHRKLTNEGLDPNTLDQILIEHFYNDTQYIFYLNYIDAFMEKFPGNQIGKVIADKVDRLFIVKLSPEKRDMLNLNFINSDNNTNPNPGS